MTDPVELLAALRLLRDGQEHCVCELMDLLGASQSRRSRHMAAFRQVSVVVDRRNGQGVRYRLNPTLPHKVRRLSEAALELPLPQESLAA